MLHFHDSATPMEETLGALNDVVRSGKARYIGVSTMCAWQFAKMLWICERHGWEKPINMQLQLNCAYREEEREMTPLCIDQGVGVTVFSPLARGLLSGTPSSVRNKTDFFTAEMYNDETSLAVARSVARVAQRRGVDCAPVAQAWVLSRPGIDSVLVGVDSVEQLDSAVAALDITLDADERHELDRNYTPCDPIRDDTAGQRIARVPRPAQGNFASEEAIA